MRAVSIIGIGQIPIRKQYDLSLRQMGATAVTQALADAGVDHVDALYAANMLSDELQGQKHLAALIADEVGLRGIEALQVRAATGSGAAALRLAYLAVASGAVELAVAVGVEKMSQGPVTPALAKALDAEQEVAVGANLISKNAALMAAYQQQYDVPANGLANFAVNAHHNALTNGIALFHKPITPDDVAQSRLIYPPIRLLHCSPICDGAAAVVLAPTAATSRFTAVPIRLLASSVATDRFRIDDRPDPLALAAARLSADRAFAQANVSRQQIDFFEVHDAFSIMACLLLEAAGFAGRGEGWRLAVERRIWRDGDLPIATMGGLKARGHPIGATALYQTCEIVLQLTDRAGPNQLSSPQFALLQSVGGAATTVLTHVFGR